MMCLITIAIPKVSNRKSAKKKGSKSRGSNPLASSRISAKILLVFLGQISGRDFPSLVKLSLQLAQTEPNQSAT